MKERDHGLVEQSVKEGISMKYTSAQAAKLLRRLNEEHDMLLAEEKESRQFKAALQEDIESARPPYDFAAMQRSLDAINAKIRVVKHAINVFNTTHTVPGFGMTVDEVLVYLPQLTKRKDKLILMSKRLEKQREDNSYSGTSIIEYNYANYRIQEARDMLSEVSETLGKLQTALDIVNTQETMEIDI